MVLTFLHLMSYGILLGSQVFQTFINGLTAFHSLRKPYFGIHQAAIFPVYFSLQSLLPIAVILTGPTALPQNQGSRSESESGSGSASRPEVANPGHYGLRGILSALISGNVYTTMTLVTLTGLINLLLFRPLTAHAVKGKMVQELKDKKRDNDPISSPSPELVAAQRRFLVIHATSIFINVCGLLATTAYGVAFAMNLE